MNTNSPFHNLELSKLLAIEYARAHNCNYNIIIHNAVNGVFHPTESTYEIVKDSYFEKERPNAKLLHKTDDLLRELIPEKAFHSPAIYTKAPGYPSRFGNKVPLRVKIWYRDVQSDIPFRRHTHVAKANKEYYVSVNSHGAVSAILPNNDLLGLLPDEFEVLEYHKEK